MTDDRFEQQLVAFLRWQAGQTGSARSVAETAAAIEAKHRRRGLPATLRLVLLLVVAALLSALALTAAGVLTHRSPLAMRNGAVLIARGACELDTLGRDGVWRTIALPTVPCPGSGYPVIFGGAAGAGDGSVFVVGRGQGCGACVSDPSATTVATQGLFLVDAIAGTATRLDGCAATRCWWNWDAVSRDGRHIGWARETSQRATTTLVIADRTGHVEQSVEVADRVLGLGIAPDGSAIAAATCCTSGWTQGAVQVTVLSSVGTRVIDISGGSAFGALAWIDDDRLLLTQSTTRVPGTQIVELDIGGDVHSIGYADANPGALAIGPEGQMAWVDDEGRLAVADMDGSNARIVNARLPFGGTLVGRPLWSPDGTAVLVAYQTDPAAAADGWLQVPLAGGDATRLSTDGEVLTWLPG